MGSGFWKGGGMTDGQAGFGCVVAILLMLAAMAAGIWGAFAIHTAFGWIVVAVCLVALAVLLFVALFAMDNDGKGGGK